MAAKPLDIPLQLPSWAELNRRCSQLSTRAIEEAPSDGSSYVRQDGEWVLLEIPAGNVGFYDHTTDQIVSAGNVALDAASNYVAGEYYTLTTSGTFITPIAELNGQTGNVGDRIVSNGTTWVILTAASDYLSAVVDDTAAGVITFTQTPISNPTPTLPDQLTNKSYVDSGDAADRNYSDSQLSAHVVALDPHGDRAYTDIEIATHVADADPHGDRAYSDAQLAAHEAAADPHGQYVLETQAIQAFVGIGYGGMVSNTPRAAPDIGAGWQIIEFDATQIATPVGVVLDLGANTFSLTREGVWLVSSGFTFEHNSSNQGRLTNIRLFNVTDAAEVNRITVGTGRNAEATSFFQGNLFEVGPTEVGDALRFEIGGGDAYSSVQWDQTTLTVYSVGEWRGVL